MARKMRSKNKICGRKYMWSDSNMTHGIAECLENRQKLSGECIKKWNIS